MSYKIFLGCEMRATLILFCLILLLAIPSCNSQASVDVLLTPSATVARFTQTPKSKPTLLLPTVTSSPTISNVPFNPPIAIAVAPASTDGCRDNPPGQLWYSSYPYDAFQLLFSDSEIEAASPKFSPGNGEIAFVASNPAQIRDADSLSEFGFERMEVIKPDGSGRLTLGEDLPAQTYIDPIMGCMNLSAIYPLQAWSPDGKRLVFTEQRHDEVRQWNNYNIFLGELGSSNLQLIQNQTDWAPFLWLNNDELLIAGDGGISRVNGLSKGDVSKSTISFPEGINLEDVINMFLQPDNSVIVSIKEHKDGSSRSLWKLSLAPTSSWQKMVEFGDTYPRTPILGKNYAVICDETQGELTILDNANWKPVGSLEVPAAHEIICGSSFQVVHHEGDDIAYFVVYSENSPALYRVTLGPGELEMTQVLDIKGLNLPTNESGYVLEFSVGN